ncbi:MAG: hypothetical protein JO047_17375 [Alphaproteobacteria bacterium]|nr:hypothetical protein [Alphaproteobacteria bacterium]
MADTEPVKTPDLTSVSEPESTDPKYLAWKRAKLIAALKHADEHPEDTSLLDEVWRKHGLEG